MSEIIILFLMAFGGIVLTIYRFLESKETDSFLLLINSFLCFTVGAMITGFMCTTIFAAINLWFISTPLLLTVFGIFYYRKSIGSCLFSVRDRYQKIKRIITEIRSE